MITTEGGDFISYKEIEESLGLDEEKFERILKGMKPPVYTQILYGEKYIRQEVYAEIEAEYLKQCHKRSTIRQAIGLIAVWDCALVHDSRDDLVAEKWSRFLNTKITGADMCDLVYRFVAMREARNTKYCRPDDADFEHIAIRWSDKLKCRVSAEDAEFLLGLYVQGKDFFEPLPMAVAKHIIRK